MLHTESILGRYVQSRAARQLSGDDMNLDSKDPLTSPFATLTDCQAIGVWAGRRAYLQILRRNRPSSLRPYLSLSLISLSAFTRISLNAWFGRALWTSTRRLSRAARRLQCTCTLAGSLPPPCTCCPCGHRFVRRVRARWHLIVSLGPAHGRACICAFNGVAISHGGCACATAPSPGCGCACARERQEDRVWIRLYLCD
jgi:hypothetical protein